MQAGVPARYGWIFYVNAVVCGAPDGPVAKFVDLHQLSFRANADAEVEAGSSRRRQCSFTHVRQARHRIRWPSHHPLDTPAHHSTATVPDKNRRGPDANRSGTAAYGVRWTRPPRWETLPTHWKAFPATSRRCRSMETLPGSSARRDQRLSALRRSSPVVLFKRASPAPDACVPPAPTAAAPPIRPPRRRQPRRRAKPRALAESGTPPPDPSRSSRC